MTQAIAKELFDYRDGNLVWKVRTSSRIHVGQIAGSKGDWRYTRVMVKKKMHYVHRLVWLWHKGTMPTHTIDHLNGDTNDNRIENLRDVKQQQNNLNLRPRNSNSSGYVGVIRVKGHNKWTAGVQYEGKAIHLGTFTDLDTAYSLSHSARHQLGFINVEEHVS